MNHFFQGSPLTTFRTCARIIVEHVEANLSGWSIDRRDRDLLRYVLGNFERHRFATNRASNIVTRYRAASELRFAIRRMLKTDPTYRFRHLTLVDDGWRTLDRKTTIDLEGLKRTVGQLLFKSGLDGWVGVVEVQAESKAKRGKGRDILPHAHLLIWTRDPAFSFDQLELDLQASPRLNCATGPETALITGKDDVTARLSIWNWIWYFFKAPAFAKNPVLRRNGSTRYYGASIRPNLAVRLIEVLSHMRMDELIMGSGEGKAIAVQLRKTIRAATKEGDKRCHESDIALFWTRNRRRAGKDAYSPPVINRWKSGARTVEYVRGPYRKRKALTVPGIDV